MVTEEEEARCVRGIAEIYHHDAVFRRLHQSLDVTTHDDLLLGRQIAHEHRILDPRTVPFHAPGDAAQSAIVADVVSHQVTATRHRELPGHQGFVGWELAGEAS